MTSKRDRIKLRISEKLEFEHYNIDDRIEPKIMSMKNSFLTNRKIKEFIKKIPLVSVLGAWFYRKYIKK